MALGDTVVYRLTIYEADETTPLLVLTSIPGGTNPYLSSPVSGDGGSFDPVRGASMMATYNGTIADVPVGSMQRVFTRKTVDAKGRQVLGYRRAVAEVSDNSGGAFVTLIDGRMTVYQLQNAANWQYTIADPWRAQQQQVAFAARDTDLITDFLARWPLRGCVAGGPVMDYNGGQGSPAFLGMLDSGGWTMRVVEHTTGGGTVTRYSLLPINVYGADGGTWKTNTQFGVKLNRGMADIINQAVAPFLNRGAPLPQRPFASATFTTIRDAIQDSYWTGMVVLIDSGAGWVPFRPFPHEFQVGQPGIGFTPYADAMAEWNALPFAHVGPGEEGIFVAREGQTALTNGSAVKVRVLFITPNEVSPIYIDEHPMDQIITLWDGLEPPQAYNAAAADAVIEGLGADLRLARRVTAPETLQNVIDKIGKAFGIGLRGGDDGEIEPFLTSLFSTTAPTASVGDADVVTGSVSAFQLDTSTGVQTVLLKTKQYRVHAVPLDNNSDRTMLDQVMDVDVVVEYNNGDEDALPFGKIDLEIPGMLHIKKGGPGGNQGQPDPITARITQIFDRCGRGLVRGSLTVRKDSSAASKKLGDEVLIDVSQLPNYGYRLGDNPAIAARAMQIIGRTVRPIGYDWKLADSGANANALATLPTLSIAASSDAPRTVAVVTVTNAAALNALGYQVRLQIATVAAGDPAPASTDYADAKVWTVGNVPTTGYALAPFEAGTHVYVRARSEIPGVTIARPSAWGSTANVQLSALDDPTSVVATPNVSDGSECLVEWVPGTNATQAVTDIFLRLSGEPFEAAVLQGTVIVGSTQFTLERLTPSTAYIVSVQHREPTTQNVSDPVDDSFTADSSVNTLVPPQYPQPFAGGQAYANFPLLDGQYGIAVVAAEYPGYIEVAEAVETAPGSGVYGSYSTIQGWIASVRADWTLYVGVAPNDGLKRKLKARHVQIGSTASPYTDEVIATPWTPQALTDYPTQLFIEFVLNDPADGVPDVYDRIRVHVVAIDPQGSDPEVRLNISPNMGLYAGPSLNTWEPNNSLWILTLPLVAAGMGLLTADARVIDSNGNVLKTITATFQVPPRASLAANQGTGSVDEDGDWQATADGGDDVLSFLYLASTSGFDSESDVRNFGTLVTGTGRFFDVSGSGLLFGETMYLTILAFDNVDPDDPDAHQMKVFHIRCAFTNITGTRTDTYTATDLVPLSGNIAGTTTGQAPFFRDVDAGRWAIYCKVFDPVVEVQTPGMLNLIVPDGRELNSVTAEMRQGGALGECFVSVTTNPVPYGGDPVSDPDSLGYAVATSTSWDTYDVILNTLSGGDPFNVFVTPWTFSNSGPPDSGFGASVFVTYTMPNTGTR